MLSEGEVTTFSREGEPQHQFKVPLCFEIAFNGRCLVASRGNVLLVYDLSGKVITHLTAPADRSEFSFFFVGEGSELWVCGHDTRRVDQYLMWW